MAVMSKEENVSQLRRELRELLEVEACLVKVFFERDALVRGRIYETSRRCGKPSCRCATGEGHAQVAFAALTPEGQRNRAVSASARERLEPLAARYRRFRKARAELARTQREILGRIDGLEEVLSVEIDLDALRSEGQ
jgi:hypothetical protein